MIQYQKPGTADSTDVSLCTLTYERIGEAAKNYLNEMASHCESVARSYTRCASEDTDEKRYKCIQNAARSSITPEERASNKLKAEQGHLLALELEERLRELRKVYERDKRLLLGARPARAAPANLDEEQTCGKNRRNEFIERPRYRRGLEDGPESIFRQMDRVQQRAREFLDVAYKTADQHDKRVRRFRQQEREMDDLIKRARTAGDPDKKGPEQKKGPSDITGTENKPPQQQAAGGGQPPGGGGGQQGGGQSGSGQPSGFDQGGGSNAGTPPSLNAGNATRGEGTKNAASKVGSDKTDAPASKTGEGLISPVATSGLAVSSGSGLGNTGLGTSRGLASTGNGRSSSSSSSPGGGGGGGLGGGGGGGGAPCVGKDCQAMSATGGQFAPVGSLGGGGMGGIGGDDSSALDNLFKTDDPKTGEGPAADALADLGTAEEGLEGLGGDVQAGGEGGEIGTAEGGDLFLRVRTMYTRAQKKGLVAGMLKKL